MSCALPPTLGVDDMTDARFPERWMNDYRLATVSDAGLRLFAYGLMWSVSNRTDGVLLDKHLPFIPNADIARAPELAEAGLWRREGDRYVIEEFIKTQTSAQQLAGLEAKKEQTRDRVAQHRERRRATRYTKDRTETGHGQEGQAVREGTSRAVPSQRPRPLPDNGWD